MTWDISRPRSQCVDKLKRGDADSFLLYIGFGGRGALVCHLTVLYRPIPLAKQLDYEHGYLWCGRCERRSDPDYGWCGNWASVDEYSPTDDHPVIYVIWNDAAAYAEWVGKRLPTAAEWEYAARDRLVGKRYPWGDEIDMIKLKLTMAIGMMETEQPKW